MLGHSRGFYVDYYNILLSSYFKKKELLYKLTSRIHHAKMCFFIYPILYKKVTYFRFVCRILKKRKLNTLYNLNQTVILEGAVSTNKCMLSVPVCSFLSTIKL